MATIRVQTPDAGGARDLARELGGLGATDVVRSDGRSSVVLTWHGGLDPVAGDALVVVERWARAHRIGFVKVRVDRDAVGATGDRAPAPRRPHRTIVQLLARRLRPICRSARLVGRQPRLADGVGDHGCAGADGERGPSASRTGRGGPRADGE